MAISSGAVFAQQICVIRFVNGSISNGNRPHHHTELPASFTITPAQLLILITLLQWRGSGGTYRALSRRLLAFSCRLLLALLLPTALHLAVDSLSMAAVRCAMGITAAATVPTCHGAKGWWVC